MKPLLERIARALCAHAGNPENTQFEGRPMWESYLPEARAVLEAIREPDDMMKEAGAEIIKNALDGQGEEAQESDAANVWRYMINAAGGGCRDGTNG